MLHDAPDDTETKSAYECLRCGAIVVQASHPGECELCGGGFQARSKSLE